MMTLKWTLSVLLVSVLFLEAVQAELLPLTGHYCTSIIYTLERYETRCGIWGWWACYAYRSVSYTNYECCPGWSSLGTFDCKYAICDGKTGTSACNIVYSDYFVKQRNGIIVRNSGGVCGSPDVCTNCNEGFYSSGAYCQACQRIQFCNLHRCTTGTSSACHYCEGEYSEAVGEYVYDRWEDSTACQEVCSWRSTGKRCYPGTCSGLRKGNGLLSSCNCIAGFSGNHCENIEDQPVITDNMATFRVGEGTTNVINFPPLPTVLSPDFKDTVWTNFGGYTKAETYFAALYKLRDEVGNIPDKPSYIDSFQFGIIYGFISLTLERGGVSRELTWKCQDASENSPQSINYRCQKSFDLMQWSLPFQHGDRVKFLAKTKNGGRTYYFDRDDFNAKKHYSLNGKDLTYSYELGFDFFKPYHCILSSSCTDQPLDVPDFVAVKPVTITWSGWLDDLSGVGMYQYELFSLIAKGSDELMTGDLVAGPTNINGTESQFEITFPDPGAYFVVLTCFDRAGNFKSTRRLLLFDDASVVTIRHQYPNLIMSATKETNRLWIIDRPPVIYVKWTDRFINERHHAMKWLNAVNPDPAVSAEYDDREGDRTIEWKTNANAILEFQVRYQIMYGETQIREKDFLKTWNVLAQDTFISEVLEDGERINIWVRAYDAVRAYIDDFVHATADSSPPIIQNLWLTRGNFLNVAVHNLLELNQMTIEWELFDLHSGILNVSWRLFDNFTNKDYLHGKEAVPTQGEAETLAACNSMYGSYARGANCYCTPFDGCYHKHFQVKPDVKDNGEGLIVGRDMGVHEYDYFIEITTYNRALLKTVLSFKLTIDISPPHIGVVHDGIVGNPEVDFQQSLTLNAYWEGFFDKESGIKFYRYKFAETCLGKEYFVLESPLRSQTFETTITSATFTAPREGKYYITVAAYNHALEHSDLVCSDGVVIDTFAPSVTEVEVTGARAVPGLVKGIQGNIWVLSRDRFVRKVFRPTQACWDKATSISFFTDLPKQRHPNDTIVDEYNDTVCDRYSGAPNSLGGVLPTTHAINLVWRVINGSAGIYDYYVGLSSTGSLDDLMTFRSTNQHTHHHILHPNIQEGEEFYILLKAISKSFVTSVKAVGPILVDTTAPEFSGSIDVHLSGTHLVATWPAGAFIESEDIFPLKYEFAVGEYNRTTSVLNYRPLSSGGDCTLTSSPTCTAISLSSLDWQLHGHHEYYVAIKVTNTAGEFTIGISSPYIHDVQLPSLGKVLEVDPETHNSSMPTPLLDLQDVDFQVNRMKIAATWSGFYHPYLDISFSIALGTRPNGTDIRGFQSVSGTSATFEGLNLNVYQKYYVSIKASSSAGYVVVSSDGVMVVQVGANFGAIIINDGVSCNGTGLSSKQFSHHTDDKRIPCQIDIDYQSSANSLHAYWTIPDSMKPYITLAYWSVEIRAPNLNVWDSLTEYEELANLYETRNAQLILEPGRRYRSKVKFCALHFCGQPVVSNGVMVITDPPVSRAMSLTYTENGQIMVVLEKFYDPNIENAQDARNAMDHYEWALTDNSDFAQILSVWERVQDSAIHALNVTHISFIILLAKPLDFSECRRLSIRGYNKVGMWSAVSMEIKDCSQIDPHWIKPKIVIDVVPEKPMKTGGVVLDDFGQAKEIILQKNGIWAIQDQDYTPYKNILSAVWPTLRHRLYDWAVIEWNVDEQVTHFVRSEIILDNPCGHPNAIACGRTDKEYVNVYLNDNNYLVDGRRYIICIHANKTAIKKERWTEYLEAVSTCSDGVTVDLTPPTPGKVWIGTEDTQMYQVSLSDLMVHWESFVDLEVYGINIHPTTVQKYEVAIGSSYGGVDVVDFRKVGITNHATFHDLLLINGHTYYATVRATDFVNRTMTVTSKGVKIDVTVPEKTSLPITVGGKFITSTLEVGACWNGVFHEVESEIDYYMWAVGSEPGVDDAMTFTLTRDTCANSDTNNPVSLKEGYPYFVSVRAFNKLGLSSLATSWAYIVETSPPIAGHVYDGNSSLADQLGIKDLDFQTDLKNLTVRWEGFYDPHSTITSYYISVGTCPQCEDILTEQKIGIKSEVTLHHLPLVSGLTYFTSITACNGADMCTTVTSDGITLDNSPPISGTVLDGVRGNDIYYQASNIYLAAEWFGYSDSQSGLDRYTYRVGTSPGDSNIIPETNLHLTEEVIITDVQQRNVSKLPLQILIYTTVRVYNKAGLYAEASSNGFMVDNTPPVFTKEATLGPIGSMLLNTLITRTTLMVEWGVYDDESFIDRQYVSIESHVGGDFNLSSIPLNGIVRDYIFTDLDLNDGSRYYVTVWCCNGAGLCTKSTTPSILMDSTPPTMGMFAINTDHAADQKRQSPGWMTWDVFMLNLAWLGFADVHSGIDYYNVTVGSTYMGRDLNQIPGEATTLYHVSSTSIVKSEGAVQTFSFEITPVVSHELIYIAVWAVNKVGLSSPVLHQAFRLVFGGVMELVRRCSAFSCVGHCVCAPEDEVCSNPRPCNDKSAIKKTEIKVMDVRNLRFGNDEENVTYVATDTVLAARWRLNRPNVDNPIWYEWSVGYEYASDPHGIFDVLSDRVWHDIGQRTNVVFSIPRGKILSYGMKYSVFVRAWYANGVYAVFKSPGVTIDTAPPKTTSIQGASVRDKLTLNQTKDIDFIRKKMTLYAEWENKFLYTTDKVSYFKIYVSTFPGGHDIHYVDESLPPSATSYFITYMKWKPYTKYYANVIAYSYAGRHRTETSDGFQLDTEPPNPGVVYDGIGLHDLEFQNNSRIISAHWHGFTDKGSGIARYYVCATDIDTDPNNGGNCTLTPWRNNGIKTQVTFDLSESLENGANVKFLVYAVDFSGYSSTIVQSDGIHIDSTPPYPENKHSFGDNLVRNPSFELGTDADKVSFDGTSKGQCQVQVIQDWVVADSHIKSSCGIIYTSNNSIAQHGRSIAQLRGRGIMQNLTGLHVGEKYRVSFYASHLPLETIYVSNREGFVKFDDVTYVFLLYTKPSRKDVKTLSSDNTNLYWQYYVYYFMAKSNTVMLQFGSYDEMTGFALDQVQVQQNYLSQLDASSTANAVKVQTVFIHDWASVHAFWSVVDLESPIVDYSWAVGYSPYGTHLQDYTSVGIETHSSSKDIHLVHNTYIYVSILATNAVGLTTKVTSDPVMIDLTPPVFSFVHDGSSVYEDKDVQSENVIRVVWNVDDKESGLDFCEWAIGTSPGGIDIQAYMTTEEKTSGKVQLPYALINRKTLYSTIRCYNQARLYSIKSSDGLLIITTPPNTESVVLDLVPQSVTEYTAMDRYQSNNTNIRLKWTGFEDIIPINRYEVKLKGEGVDLSTVIIGQPQGSYTYMELQRLNLLEGNYTAIVTGINLVDSQSSGVNTTFMVATNPPRKAAGVNINIRWDKTARTITLSWPGLFSSNIPLYYEVSAGFNRAEIGQWISTTMTQYTFTYADKEITSTFIYGIVRAVNNAGLYTTASKYVNV